MLVCLYLCFGFIYIYSFVSLVGFFVFLFVFCSIDLGFEVLR